jgi:hypothetical protein
MSGWLDLADVKAYLGLAPADTFDETWLSSAVGAAEPFVQRARPDAFPQLVEGGGPDFTVRPAADAYGAALQLAGRLYQRRNSAMGVAAFNELGGPVYVAKFDPDIERGLRVGAYARPAVG